ncbi:MAG: domain S-box/diguanylate cyclase protein [Xanthobacteraceae bacterium]|nr:domain S-box/diguanylate cyclase protein [Xanthobacteraceae bacterium]
MAIRFIRNRLGIAAKLYCVAALSGVTVVALVFASIHFAGVTEQAANRLYRDGFSGIQVVTNLQALLEQHRRIVESAPAEVDRVRLEASQRAMIDNGAQLTALVRELTNSKSDPVQDGLELEMQSYLPNLIKSGQEVLFFAYNFAQDNAISEATKYSALADQFEGQIKLYRVHRLELANGAVTSMFESARSLTLWVSISALAALILIGPLGLTITSSVLRRLARITASMTRLANHDASAEVPSRGDRDEVGNMARAVQVFKDNAVELLLRKTEAEQATIRLGVAINNMTHGLCMFGADQRMIICNDRYKAMYDLPDDLTKPGAVWQDILLHRENVGMLGKSIRQAIGEKVEAADTGISTYTNSLPDGRVIAVSRQTMPEGGWVAVHEDVTERQHAEARITHLAHHDHLTDLPNRAFFREELTQAVGRMRRDESFAVLWLDLDRFKNVNDTLGHSVGDVLLKQVGLRLGNCAGPGNFTARLGGDEFSIICGHGQNPDEIGRLAQRIIDAVSLPYSVDGHQIIVGVTIGIAIAPNDGVDPDQLLKNADIAMYRAKAEGRGTYRFFEPEMDRLIQARRSLEIDLRQALTNGQLELYYQPLINRVSGGVTAMEALLRWNHPSRGLIQPGDFIPLAEEAGLISSLGEWVVRTACAEALTWPSNIKVAVNLSAIQFKGGNLVHTILSALARSGLVASRLEVEITESVLLDDDPATVAVLHQLRGLGVRIVMDDFGTGYSSLSYFRRFPFDKIKIDRSFIRDVTDESDGLKIVRSIIQLANSLKIDVVAEGVETAEQLRIVSQEGCTEFQGYFFSKPQPASRIADVIKRCGRQIKAVA